MPEHITTHVCNVDIVLLCFNSFILFAYFLLLIMGFLKFVLAR